MQTHTVANSNTNTKSKKHGGKHARLLPDDDNAHEEISEYNSASSKDKQKNSLMEKSRNRMYWKSDAAEGADTKAEEQNLEDDFDDSSALEIDVRQKRFKNLSQTANFH